MIIVSIIFALLLLIGGIYCVVGSFEKSEIFSVLAIAVLIIGFISGIISGVAFKTTSIDTSTYSYSSHLFDEDDFGVKKTTNYALMYGIWCSAFVSSMLFAAIGVILENQERKIKLLKDNHTEHMNYIKLLNKKEIEKNEEEHKKKEEQLFFDK